jgi:hypothetical protein
MDCNSYWLIVVDNDQVTVSAVIYNGQKFNIASIGPSVNWDIDNPITISEATDKSLSDAAQAASLAEDQEPESAAFILPSFWVGVDGKILSTKLSIIETLCRNLKLKPLGFISCDDAFVENVNINEKFPSSFIFVDIKKNRLDISLVLMGKIKERIAQHYNNDFNPVLIEDGLRQLETDNSLPPQIFITGNIASSTVDDIKEYPWIGKKALDIFFHLPEINFVKDKELMDIYSNFINNQLIPEPIPSLAPKEEIVVPEDNPPADNLSEDDSLEEVKAEDLGFSQIEEREIETETEVDTNLPLVVANPIIPQTKKIPKLYKIPKLPKIKLPKFSLKLNFKFFWILAFLPLLVLLLLFINRSSVTLFINPYPLNFSKELILDSTIDSFDSKSNKIPVILKNFDIQVSTSVSTTGRKIIGERARGGVIIYNKLDKTQNLPKGEILLDSSGKQYELITPVQIPGSSYDLAAGIIKLGQTKTVVSAKDIGPEWNIAKDTQLTFKNSADNYIAKSESDFTGGSKEEISVVSKDDKITLEAQLKEEIKLEIDKKIKNDIANLSGAIADTIQQKQKRIDYLRDVGEPTDTLSGTLDADVQVFMIDSKLKDEIISSIIKQNPEYLNFSLEPNYTLGFKPSEIDSEKAKGTLSIEGDLLPVINETMVKGKIAGKFEKSARKYLDSNIDKIYNISIKSSLGPLGKILPISLLTNSIDLSVKSK